MKKNLKITCPACRTAFSPSDSIWAELKSSIENELNEEIICQQKELEKKKSEYQRLQFSLSKERADLDKLVKEKVASGLLLEEKNLRRKIEEEIGKKKEAELDLLNKQLISKTNEISGLNKLKRKMAIESEEKEAKIIMKYDSMLEEKLKEAKLSVQAESTEKHKLEIMQKEKLISDLKTQLDITKNKIEQNSSQLIGEVQELRLEAILEETHGSTDKIIPIPKGINGADCYQEIKSDSGALLGKILYESKFTKTFSRGWLQKMHEDNKSIGAEVLVLVTKTMPKELEGQRFGIVDGIFITKLSFVKPLSILLKYSILKVSQVQMKYKGHDSKQKVLFDYITSQEFENLSKSVLTQLENLKISMDQEKQRLVKIHSEREQMIQKAIISMTEFFGNINGICTSNSDNLIALPKAV